MNPDILRITHRGTNVKSKVLREPQRHLEWLGMTLAGYFHCLKVSRMGWVLQRGDGIRLAEALWASL